MERLEESTSNCNNHLDIGVRALIEIFNEKNPLAIDFYCKARSLLEDYSPAQYACVYGIAIKYFVPGVALTPGYKLQTPDGGFYSIHVKGRYISISGESDMDTYLTSVGLFIKKYDPNSLEEIANEQELSIANIDDGRNFQDIQINMDSLPDSSELQEGIKQIQLIQDHYNTIKLPKNPLPEDYC
jgi:hypothetical protein